MELKGPHLLCPLRSSSEEQEKASVMLLCEVPLCKACPSLSKAKSPKRPTGGDSETNDGVPSCKASLERMRWVRVSTGAEPGNGSPALLPRNHHVMGNHNGENRPLGLR
nr:uncharacterized protein LOC106845332 [Equus asinus]